MSVPVKKHFEIRSLSDEVMNVRVQVFWTTMNLSALLLTSGLLSAVSGFCVAISLVAMANQHVMDMRPTYADCSICGMVSELAW